MSKTLSFSVQLQTEILPLNPELPAELFTFCLITPIPTALLWFLYQNLVRCSNLPAENADLIPGDLSDRKTHGENVIGSLWKLLIRPHRVYYRFHCFKVVSSGFVGCEHVPKLYLQIEFEGDWIVLLWAIHHYPLLVIIHYGKRENWQSILVYIA